MKKRNRALSLASLLLVLVTATTSLVGGTLAQYTSSASGSDTATVAKWDIEVNGTDITKEQIFAFDLFDTIKDSDGSAEADVKSTLIAPGTSGSFTFNVANKSEVDAKGTVTFTVDKPAGMNLVFSNSPIVDLPEEYTQLEYVESASRAKASFVNTTYVPNANTRIVADVQFHKTTDTMAAVFGTDTYRVFRTRQNGVEKIQAYWIFADDSERYLPLPSVNNINQRMTLEIDGRTVFLNGIQGDGSMDAKALKSPTYPLTILGSRNGTAATAVGSTGEIRLFSMQIYDGSTLKYNFVPAKNSAGVAGLYDLVEGKFYDSDSSTAFTAGPEVNPVILGVNETFATWTTGTLGTLNAQNTIYLDMNETESATVYWKWAYEDGTTATDNSDTAVGIDAVGGDVSAIITATAVFEQVD